MRYRRGRAGRRPPSKRRSFSRRRRGGFKKRASRAIRIGYRF